MTLTLKDNSSHIDKHHPGCHSYHPAKTEPDPIKTLGGVREHTHTHTHTDTDTEKYCRLHRVTPPPSLPSIGLGFKLVQNLA